MRTRTRDTTDMDHRKNTVKMGFNVTVIHSVNRAVLKERATERNIISKTGPKLLKPILPSKNLCTVPALHRRLAGNRSVAKSSPFAPEIPLPALLGMFRDYVNYVELSPETNEANIDPSQWVEVDIAGDELMGIYPTAVEAAAARVSTAELQPYINPIDAIVNEDHLAHESLLSRQNFPAQSVTAGEDLHNPGSAKAIIDRSLADIDRFLAGILERAQAGDIRDALQSENSVDELTNSLAAAKLTHSINETESQPAASHESYFGNLHVAPKSFDDLAESIPETAIAARPIETNAGFLNDRNSVGKMLSAAAGMDSSVQGLLTHSLSMSSTSNSPTVKGYRKEVITVRSAMKSLFKKRERLSRKKTRAGANAQIISEASTSGKAPVGYDGRVRAHGISCPWSTRGGICNVSPCCCKADAREARRVTALQINGHNSRVMKRHGGTEPVARRSSLR